MADDFLPYGRQDISEADIDAVAEILRGDYLTTGPALVRFEDAFASVTGARHAVCCSSGTAALHLAALVLGLDEGDLVVVPSMTFLATANAARYAGAEVEFCDVDPDSGLMTDATLHEAVGAAHKKGARLRAVFPVHLNGSFCDMTAIRCVADEYDLAIVEDACHALGGESADGILSGTCAQSDMATFSLHPVKTITSGEGGIVTTNDPNTAVRLRVMRNHGMTREAADFRNHDVALDESGNANPWYYEMAEPGYNYRLTDFQAALALSQLGRLEKFVERRRELAALYDEALAGLTPLVRPIKRASNQNPSLHLYAVLIDFKAAGMSRARLMRDLKDEGIGTQVHYIPVHRQPYYYERYGTLELPGADAYYARCLSLPLFPSMEDGDVGRVVSALSRVLGTA